MISGRYVIDGIQTQYSNYKRNNLFEFGFTERFLSSKTPGKEVIQ